jgi:hypothetical protein
MSMRCFCCADSGTVDRTRLSRRRYKRFPCFLTYASRVFFTSIESFNVPSSRGEIDRVHTATTSNVESG